PAQLTDDSETRGDHAELCRGDRPGHDLTTVPLQLAQAVSAAWEATNRTAEPDHARKRPTELSASHKHRHGMLIGNRGLLGENRLTPRGIFTFSPRGDTAFPVPPAPRTG